MAQTGVVDCPDHGPACALIVHATDDNRHLWVSHAPAETHVECRLGEETPHAVDRRPRHDGKHRRWLPMCDPCADHFGASQEHRRAAFDAARRAGIA